MPIETWIFYVGTVFVLLVTPGPSHLLMLSNSVVHGFSRSWATAIGDLSANALQMLAAGLGVAALIIASQAAFSVIKWAGVAYLVWLGLRIFLKAGSAGAGASAGDRAKVSTLWWQGFITSAVNPKAVVFFAALFPQFIDQALPFWPQLLVLSVTYIAIDGAFLMSYGAGAGWIGRRLGAASQRWLDRIGGTFLIGAAVLLSLKTVRQAQ